jgi:hypothetical protein
VLCNLSDGYLSLPAISPSPRCEQKQDAELGEEDYAVVFKAIMTWQLRPITSARQPLLHLARRSLDVAQSMADLAVILEVIDYLDGRIEPDLQRAVLRRAEQLLGHASSEDVELLMQTLQQYGMPLAVEGGVLAAAVQPLLEDWHIRQVAELMFGVAASGQVLPAQFLDACTARALQLLPAASAVQQAHLLRAFAAVGHTPPHGVLNGWLDRTVEGLQQLSWQARLGLAPASSLAATAGSLGGTLSLSDEDITPAAASSIKSDIISSLESSYAASSGGRGSPFSRSSSSGDLAAWSERPQGPAAVVVAATLDLLAAAAKLQLQVEPGWVMQCLECLEGCAAGIGDAELEQLLLVVEQLGVTPEASWCDAIVQEVWDSTSITTVQVSALRGSGHHSVPPPGTSHIVFPLVHPPLEATPMHDCSTSRTCVAVYTPQLVRGRRVHMLLIRCHALTSCLRSAHPAAAPAPAVERGPCGAGATAAAGPAEAAGALPVPPSLPLVEPVSAWAPV